MALLAGGMITAPLLSVFVIPAVYLVLRRRKRDDCGPSP